MDLIFFAFIIQIYIYYIYYKIFFSFHRDDDELNYSFLLDPLFALGVRNSNKRKNQLLSHLTLQ